MNPGQTLAHYRIVEPLGAGGMGEVYKALDTKLKRTVAIKILPAEWVTDSQRRRRFVQEAQAASALDHPNIVTIHDIVEADGQHFIVMQYLEGKTLRELLGRLTISQTLDYAKQIADGLAAAHAHGIIHRDVKPENVIINEQGRAKILDFGLAKLTEPADLHEAETHDQVRLTNEGYILGTAAYMSPEQAQGKKVDARSDIFSFGSVVYELLTGKQAFQGDNLASVMAAIIRDEPAPVTNVVPNAPPGVDGFLRRALEKDPARRYSSMGEVHTELENIRLSIQSPRPVPSKSLRWLGAAAALIMIGALFYTLRDRLLPPSSVPFSPPRVVPVTSYPGNEYYPMLSPDGSRVAFLMNDDVYVQNISGGDALQLTNTSTGETSVTWTPDGQRITFLRTTETGHDIYWVPALGGAEMRITSAAGMPGNALGMSWSPDGKVLAYVDRDEPQEPVAIFLLDLETGDRTRLTRPEPPSLGDRNPIFSPDGTQVAFLRMTTDVTRKGLYVKHLSGGEEAQSILKPEQIIGFDWLADGGSLVYSSHRRGGHTLFRIDIPGGEPRLIEGVEGKAFWPSVSRTGSFLVYEQRTDDWNIWRAPGPRNESGEPTKLFGSTRVELAPQYSPDGTRIAFGSNRSGNMEVWVCDSDGNNPMRLTSLGAYSEGPRWSADGEQIVFFARLLGHADIYRIPAAGGVPVRLTEEPSNDGLPSWSRDGQRIYFFSDRTGAREIWVMTAEGQNPTRLSQNGGMQAVESEDGTFVYFIRSEDGQYGVWRLPLDGGEEELVLNEVYPLRWALTEDGIAYVNETTLAFDFFELATGETSPFASPSGPLMPIAGGVSISPDGRWFVYPQNDAPGDDIVMLTNFR